jgi:hypothetical protein
MECDEPRRQKKSSFYTTVKFLLCRVLDQPNNSFSTGIFIILSGHATTEQVNGIAFVHLENQCSPEH